MEIHERVLDWYDENARDLPWRGPQATPWSVMVSEFMLQQTPVARVLPVHEAWLARWPQPVDLAEASTGDAVRLWGRLGYPRRALRLHAAATQIVERHDGHVPEAYDDLLALPGVGDYTAAAVASFAYGARHVVLDTNVRRVLARVVSGTELPPRSVTSAERALARDLLPADAATAATWSVAVMELGALVCTAARPRCAVCPVAASCAWHQAGHPAYDGPPRAAQAWQGTDRQCRGRLLAAVRDAPGPVPQHQLDGVWGDRAQRTRCLTTLVADGLIREVTPGYYSLP